MTRALSLASATAATEEAADRRFTMTEAEFLDFYAHTARPLKLYLQRLTGHASLADDLLQESYLRMLRSDTAITDASLRKSYLYRVATNLARDHYRSARSREESLAEHQAARPAGGSLERSIQTTSDVGRILGEMQPRERELIWLAYAEGASHREIAAILSVKEQSVRPLLFRARRKLAALLRQRGLGKEASNEAATV